MTALKKGFLCGLPQVLCIIWERWNFMCVGAETFQQMDEEIKFLAGRQSSFRFECKACGRCCGEYEIMLSPYDIFRLRKATGSTTSELIKSGTVRIERMSFKKAFGFGPVVDMFEMLGVSNVDTVPVAFMGYRNEDSGRNVCEFLASVEKGKRFCSIYEHRPGMCRLHPLGCVTIGVRRKWIFRRPLCETDKGSRQTVDEWLRESRARPFLEANSRFLRMMRALLENPETLPAVTEKQWQGLEKILYDFDSIQPNEKPMNMDRIEKMFYRWLTRMNS